MVEFAYLMVAMIYIVVTHSSDEISCDFIDSNTFLNIFADFLSDERIDSSKKNLEGFSDHFLQFLQEFVKASHKDPIIISKDSLLDLLHKVRLLHQFNTVS